MHATDAVYNVIEAVGSSPDSWEQAARNALHDASQNLEGTLTAEVLTQEVEAAESGGIVFRVVLAVREHAGLGADLVDGVRPKRILIVANQTLASSGLEQLVHEMVAAAPSHFHVVVPQISTSAIHADPSGLINLSVHPSANEGYVTARREAENRLQTFRELFEESHEATLTGEVVLGDPLQAVRRVMERSNFDEIIVSTLPPGVSKWLRMDLPHRIERAFDVPVTSLVQELELIPL